VLVAWGSPLGDSTSHMISRWGAPRMGSGTTRTGLHDFTGKKDTVRE
jgi:hypothetical protein